MSHAEPIILQDRESLMRMTRATMRVMDSWGLDTEQVLALLAMPDSVRARAVNGFRRETPFPDNPVVKRRASYILRIADALRTTFPTSPNMASRWIRQGHRRFGQSTPLAVMLQGEEGLVAILAQLDCTFAWDLSGSKAV
jgi:hypothetical protein